MTGGTEKTESSGDMVAFSFFEKQKPYNLLQRISVDRDHYNGVIMMEDIRTEKSESATPLIAAMITPDDNDNPVKLIKFKRDGETVKTWSD